VNNYGSRTNPQRSVSPPSVKSSFPACTASRRKYEPHEGNGINLSVNEREALECGGLTPLSNSPIDRGIGKRRQAAALQRLPPILMSKLNAIALMKAECIFLFRNLNRASDRASISYSAPPRSATR